MLKKYYPLILIVVVGLIPLADLFLPGLPLTHDGKDHVARIANFYQALSEGFLIPRWGGNLNWGYGHPVMMFLYPLSSYFASIFHFLGFSIIDSLKIVFGLTFIASGIGMYLWISRLLGVYAGIVAALLYMFAPYRFVNLYVRGAIGEHVSFAFIPIILFFITKLFLDKKSKWGLATNFMGIGIFTAGLVLAHNALSILFLSFAGLYTLILFIKKKELLKLTLVFLGVLYGFILSAFFWLPAYLEGKYTLRDIVTGNAEYADRFVNNFSSFFVPSWSYGITGQLSVQIGIVHIALIIVGALVVLRMKKSEVLLRRVFISTLIFLFLSLFMMVKESNFIWSSISLIQKFQFPWRFLSVVVLTSSVMGAYFIYLIKDSKKAFVAIGALILLLVLFYGNYWRANGYLIQSDSFFKQVYHGTTDTGESSPIWSIRFMEQEPSNTIEILEGDAIIEEVHRSTGRHEYKVEVNEKTRVRENTLYFPGWNIYLNDRKLDASSEIEFQDEANRGVMTFWVEPGIEKIVLKFENTKIRTASEIVSLSAIFGIILFVIIWIIRKKNEKNS